MCKLDRDLVLNSGVVVTGVNVVWLANKLTEPSEGVARELARFDLELFDSIKIYQVSIVRFEDTGRLIIQGPRVEQVANGSERKGKFVNLVSFYSKNDRRELLETLLKYVVARYPELEVSNPDSDHYFFKNWDTCLEQGHLA